MDLDSLYELAENGDALAQNNLGVALMTGDEVSLDEKQAMEWFRRSSAQGNPDAKANFGVCLLLGKGTDVDLSAALPMLESAYLSGANYVLQIVLEAIDNKDVDIDSIRRLSAEKDPHAAWLLALWHLSGLHPNGDPRTALELLEESYNQENPVACLIIARIHANNEPPNLLRADAFFERMKQFSEKQVGHIWNKQIQREMLEVKERIKNEYDCILYKTISACTKEGVSEDKYVDDFLSGKLFMKTLDQFGDLAKRDASSDNDFRGDVLEGFSESFGVGYNPHFFKQDSSGIVADGQLGSIDVLTLRKKVLCLGILNCSKSENFVSCVPERMKAFGKYTVIIKDVDEFLNRVRSAFQKLRDEDSASYELAYDRVSYDVTLDGKMVFDEFHKSESYAWQNEFRISIDFSEGKFSDSLMEHVTDFAILSFPGRIEKDNNPRSVSDMLYFDIGDISDICQVMETEEACGLQKEPLSINVNPSRIIPHRTPHYPRPTFCKSVTLVDDGEGSCSLAISKEAFFSAIL